jgi:hypothetical protein
MSKKVMFAAKPAPAMVAEKTADAWVSGGAAVEEGAPPAVQPAAPPARDDAEPMKRLTIDIPASLHMRIKAQSAMRGAKMADEIRVLLEQHFAV